jgi:transposase
MKKQGQYSVSFYSDRLSETKYHELKAFILLAITTKNKLSEEFNKDVLENLKLSKFDYQKVSLNKTKEIFTSHFTKQISDDIYVLYKNKYDYIKSKMEFKVIRNIEYVHYQRDTQKNRKGDIKEINHKRETTRLSETLTYLCKYGDENILIWLPPKMQAPDIKPAKLKYYKKIVETINKFGLKRLLDLALERKQRVVDRYFDKPIVFKKLTIRGVSRLSRPILSYNRNFNSIIKAYIEISWHKKWETLKIPIKYSKKYQGSMSQFQNGEYTSYSVSICGNFKIKVILNKKADCEYPSNKNNYVGIDVNTKHNLLQCSNGASIDFDRRLVSTICKELKKTDELKKLDKDYISGKRRTRKLEHLRRELISKNRNEIANLCKKFNSQEIDHAIFENLDNGFGKCYVKTEDDVNFNRMVKELHLSSIKDEFEHIGRKYGIATSFVHSAYTSQTCPECGCIDKENRESQEEFKCVECGYEANADLNASVNIRNRVVLTVLRDELLEKSTFGNGSYVPQSLSRERVKEILLSLRKHLPSKDKVNKEFDVKSEAVDFVGF